MNELHYSYRIVWSSEDEEYLGLCAEFPSLSWLAPTQAEALAGIAGLVADTVTGLIAEGQPVPQPIGERDFSGRPLYASHPNCTASWPWPQPRRASA